MNRAAFKLLKEKVEEKVKKEYLLEYHHPPKMYQIYGLPKHKEDIHTIKHYLLNDKNVKNYYKKHFGNYTPDIRASYLYQKFKKDYEKEERATIELSDIYKEIFFIYIGETENKIEEEAKKISEVRDSSQPSPESDGKITYSCYYYSFVSHRVKKFNLTIDYNNKKVEEQGLHDHDNQVVYSGKLSEKNKHLFIDLFSDSGDELKIIIFKGRKNANKNRIMLGTYLGVSANEYLITAQFIMIKETEENTDALEVIERYLMLERYNFWTRDKIINDVNELKVRNLEVNFISHMVGNYRIWRYDDHNNIIQSKMTIGKNYECKIETPIHLDEDKPLIGLLRISNKTGYPRLIISTHPKNGTDVMAVAIVKIPLRVPNSSRSFRFIEGVFCSTEVKDEKLEHKKLAMYYEGDNDSFLPEILDKQKVHNLTLNNFLFQVEEIINFLTQDDSLKNEPD